LWLKAKTGHTAAAETKVETWAACGSTQVAGS
jgi:hypothetical protein